MGGIVGSGVDVLVGGGGAVELALAEAIVDVACTCLVARFSLCFLECCWRSSCLRWSCLIWLSEAGMIWKSRMPLMTLTCNKRVLA